MRILPKVSMLLLCAGFLASAHAADTPKTADIRCLVIGSLMVVSAKNDAQRNVALMMSIYWVGRLDAFSAQEIEDAMVRESEMTALQIQSETVRCAEILQLKGEMMTEIGNNIMRRAKDQQNAKPSEKPNNSKPTT